MSTLYRLIPSTLLLLFLSIHMSNPIIHRSERVVQLKYGKLQGFVVKPNHRALGMVEVFLGVPYAAAPVGNFRFMPPMQPFPWSYLKRAETMPPVCPQKPPDVSKRKEALRRMPEGRYNYLQRLLPMLRNQSEDCLYLNIYVPVRANNAPNKRVAVLVYIHGESYEWNSGNPYDGTTLASYGQVIVVTINFRLGVLGFLRPALRESHVSNFGLLDQIAALHWIKENIAEFSGDPERVAIFGHGTGAALANLLLISPVTQVSKGLFQRAILMSGSALSKWALTWDPYKYTIQVSKAVGCPLNDRGDELVQCLRSKTVEELLSVHLHTPPFTTPLGPIVDGIIIKSDPLRSMRVDSTNFGRYELMYGVTLAESYKMLNAAEVMFGMVPDRKNKLLKAFVSNNFDHHGSSIYNAILTEYKSYSTAALPDERTIRDQTLEIFSDAQIVAPVVNMADLHSDLNSKSYFYVFNHQSAFGDYAVSQGTVHGEELAYVFGAPLVGGFSHFGLNYTLEEVFLSEIVMMMWTNFAKTGNPNLPTPQEFLTPGATPDWEDNMRTMWPPYEKITQQYLHIDMQVMKNSYYRARKLAFWNRLIPDLVSSSVINIDPFDQEPFPGATYPTITLVKPEYTSLFQTERTTTRRPSYYPDGPKPIKPVQPFYSKPSPMPVYPIPDDKKEVAPSEQESKQPPEASIAGAPIGIVVGVGVIIFCINCIAMALIFMYYRKKKIRSQQNNIKEQDSVTTEASEASSLMLTNSTNDEKDSDRKSRRKIRSNGGERESQDADSESVSRRSSVSRDSSSRRKHSQSLERVINVEVPVPETKVKKPVMNGNGHRRNKSDHSLYIEIGKNETKTEENEDTRPGKQPVVTFNTLGSLPGKNLNRSTSSIASKTSVKSTSSRTSARSGTSRASVKSGSSLKAVKKNSSSQSLTSPEFNWGLTKDVTTDGSVTQICADTPLSEKNRAVAVLQQRNYPKVLPDQHEVDGCATLPRIRPPPPPRSTSLTARDIQELEKLQEAYRKTRPPRLASTDSCEHSGSEPFYSMGGGEAPARAPGLMYGATLSATSARRNSRKSEGQDYDQYQKYQPSYQMREPSSSHVASGTEAETQLQLSPAKPYLTYGDNRAARGPLASFTKVKAPPVSPPVDYEMTPMLGSPSIPSVPPPVPAHQIPLTPSILKTQSPPLYCQPPLTPEPKPKSGSPLSSAAMFDQSENTGTIKRNKQKGSNASSHSTDTLEKPLKSALKSTSAYDKPAKNSTLPLHAGIVPSASRAAGGPTSPLSVSSTGSNSPSLSSSGSGLPSSTELKSILVKKGPRPTTAGSTSSKQKPFDSSTGPK